MIFFTAALERVLGVKVTLLENWCVSSVCGSQSPTTTSITIMHKGGGGVCII